MKLAPLALAAGTAYAAPVVPPEIAGVSVGEMTCLPGARSA